MAITFVQSAQNTAASGSSVVVTPSAPPSAGNLIVVPVYWINTLTVTSVTDTAGNTFVQATGAASVGSGGYQSDIWYCQNCTAGAGGYTITVQMSGAILRLRATYTEWAGAKTTSVFNTATNLSGPAAPTSPSITPTQAGELLVAVISSNDNTITSRNAPPWTVLPPTSGQSNEVDYYINAPLSSQQVVYQPTTSENFGASAASFLAAATSNATQWATELVF